MLVIIGLIVGGVLVGKNLITAAAIRSQISQIEKYNTAVNTFRVKYGYLPGDIPEPAATQLGLQPRGAYQGEGDGNGVIEGMWTNSAGANWGAYPPTGEEGLFWNDLSAFGLVDGKFATATSTSLVNGGAHLNASGVASYLPAAKIGQGYVYVWSGGYNSISANKDGLNYFGVSNISGIDNGCNINSSPSFAVIDAYNIDAKIDDGIPQSGKVQALYVYGNTVTTRIQWSDPGATQGAPFTTATAGSSSTCFDNNNTAGVAQKYSTSQSNGTNVNCALSFRF